MARAGKSKSLISWKRQKEAGKGGFFCEPFGKITATGARAIHLKHNTESHTMQKADNEMK